MGKKQKPKKGSLGEYEAKRKFGATPEPAPTLPAAGAGPLLFVVQMHSATRLHYDFRIELDGVLHSWAVPKGPSLNPQDKRLAVYVENHPYDYASFEGVIPPKQYGAGEVIVWDCGVYSPDEEGTFFHDREEAQRQVREGIAKGKLSLQLRGEKLKGSFALVKTAKDPKSWLLIKHKDRHVSEADVTERDRSVLSGRSVRELKFLKVERLDAARLAPAGPASKLPDKLAPMLAEQGREAFSKPDWMWEPKLDGYRVLAFVKEDGVRLQSRNGHDLTENFPALAGELAQQAAHDTVLDGEIVAFNPDGKPSFNALQNRARLKHEREIAVADRNIPVAYFAFDLPFFAGVDLRAAPYRERRRYLSQCLLPSPRVSLVHATADGPAMQDAALASGFEGVVGKRLDSRYETGQRSGAWVKVKPSQSAEFVIGGYTAGQGARESLGAIAVGYWEDSKLKFASHVGSGFDDRTIDQVLARLKELEQDDCPFHELPERANITTWVKPELVAEVKFHQWTGDGHLRAPVFLRLREDVDAKAVTRVTSFRRKPESSASASPLDPGLRRGDEEHGGDSEVAQILEQLDNNRADLPLLVGPHRIRLTHLNRVYWPADEATDTPALTKRDLLRYFAQVSPFILPHLAQRPLTMIRMPAGITGERFFQKHWEQERPEFVDTVTVWSEHKSQKHEYLVCNKLPTLLWLAQSGTLEFHIWHSRANVADDTISKSTDYASSRESLEASVLNYPDHVVFDIDPYIYSGKEAKGAEPELNDKAFEKGKEVAFWLRELLLEMSLEPIVKTSGKTGLHVFVPIRRTIDFDAARHVSELVGRHLMRLHPRDITQEWSVPKRTGKIFMDYNMNVRGKTLNVAYSPRGEPGAPVSMPLTWEELAGAHPLDFRLTNAAQRLAQTGDRWADFIERKQDLQAALNIKPG